MLERQEIDGRPAVVAYLYDDLTPADKDDAALAKVIFQDDEGGDVWLRLRFEPLELSPEDADISDIDEFDDLFGLTTDDAKSSKEKAGYVKPGADRPAGQRCGLCTMFVRAAEDASDPGACTAVEGPVDPYGWCTYYARDHRRS